jgi:hypothetical protein
MTSIGSWIYNHDLLTVKGYARSNHDCRSENERRREGVHWSVTTRLGSAVMRHGPHQSSSARGSGVWKAMGLRAKQRAVRGDSYLGQRWRWVATAAACDGGTTPLFLGIDDSSPWCTSNRKDVSYDFLTSYSCFLELQLHWRWRNQVARWDSFKI